MSENTLADNIVESIHYFIGRTATVVAMLSFTGVLLLTTIKLTSNPSITWLDVLMPVVMLLLAAFIITLTLVVASIVSGVSIFVVVFAVGKLFVLLNKRKAAQAVENKLKDAESYDADARAQVNATPLGVVANAMGNAAKGLANFNRSYDHRQDDRRL